MHDIHDELIVELAVLDLLARTVNQISLGLIQHANLGVGARGGLLHVGVAEHQVGIHCDRTSADGKVVECAANIDAAVNIGWDLL